MVACKHGEDPDSRLCAPLQNWTVCTPPIIFGAKVGFPGGFRGRADFVLRTSLPVKPLIRLQTRPAATPAKNANVPQHQHLNEQPAENVCNHSLNCPPTPFTQAYSQADWGKWEITQSHGAPALPTQYHHISPFPPPPSPSNAVTIPEPRPETVADAIRRIVNSYHGSDKSHYGGTPFPRAKSKTLYPPTTLNPAASPSHPLTQKHTTHTKPSCRAASTPVAPGSSLSAPRRSNAPPTPCRAPSAASLTPPS
ncbi:hypothetical protein V494_01572, partial [Pseudogymnoascus sp. VKM F-4513 (FW-928)]